MNEVDAPNEAHAMNEFSSPRLRIEVDPERCVGNAMCLALAPGVFAHNESRQSEVRDPEGGSRDDILEAAENCPTGAIRVRDADTGARLFP